jgi:long-chain acyl-CoA synthetase
METTFPRLLLQHAAQRPAAAAMREKEYGIWQTLTWSALAQMVQDIACGLHQAGLRRGEHIVVIGANRPRLYATMLAAQALGAIPVPLYQDAASAECVFPINNAEVRFAIVEDQEQVDKLLEVRGQCPQLQAIWFDDPRGLRNYDEPGLASLDSLAQAGRALARSRPRPVPARSRRCLARRRGRDVLHLGHHRQSQGRDAFAPHAARPRQGRRRLRPPHRARGSAGLPAAGLGRPEHLQLRAVAGARLRRQLPRVGGHGDDRPEGDRAHLLLRAAAGVRGPAHHRDDPHGGRQRSQARAVPALHGPGQARRARADGPAAGRPARPPGTYRLGDLLVYGPLRNNLGFSRVRVAYTAGEAIGPDLFTSTAPSASTSSSCTGPPRRRCSSACSRTTRPAPTRWACRSRAWRSRWPTTARSWCARPACSRATTRTRRPRPKC